MLVSTLEKAKERLPLPQLMRQLGLDEHAKKSAKCPFHDDRNNSFSVFEREGRWAWNCFAGCGGGDAPAFLARSCNLSNADACRRYIELAGLTSEKIVSCSFDIGSQYKTDLHQKPEPASSHTLTDDQCRGATLLAEALAADRPLCERIARWRGWSASTIRNLALEPSLGWDCEKQCLSFLYDTGVKLRKFDETGERLIWWAFGKSSLWRGSYLSQAKTVYICEGETDAISLIDAGVENDLSKLTVALPSASGFSDSWAALFRDKDVILALDADKAGREATMRVSKSLARCARSLRQLNWKGLRDAV